MLLFAGLAVTAFSAEPLAFNHKLHGSLKQPCETCHPGGKKSDRAELPLASKCETCHPGKGLKPPTVSATRLRDFVFFSHARHADAQIVCSECHGDVYKNTDVQKQLTMKSCFDCHKMYKASTGCNTCHDLGQ
jgi:hypothetical protein